MKLSYEATLDDIVEPAVRLFLRSKTYTTNRWRGAVLSAAVFAVFAFLGFHSSRNVNIVWICTAASVWGAAIFLLTYRSTVRKRIQNYVTREMKGPWPRAAECEITNGRLIATDSGVRRSFNLADLTSVHEDATRLELTFVDNGLCVIPLRAFQSADEKAAFLSAAQAGTIMR